MAIVALTSSFTYGDCSNRVNRLIDIIDINFEYMIEHHQQNLGFFKSKINSIS